MVNTEKKISIVDYGTSNLGSLKRAFLKIKANIEIINSPNNIVKADCLVLPGVGSFGSGINKLKNFEIFESIKRFADKGNPLLGICLGKQLLLSASEENSEINGLDLIKGKVIKIPTYFQSEVVRKIPHIGWAQLLINKEVYIKKNNIFDNITEEDYFYFVHSFMCMPENKKTIIANSLYKKQLISAVIQYENILGFQFHPEISGKSGLKIINNFIETL